MENKEYLPGDEFEYKGTYLKADNWKNGYCPVCYFNNICSKPLPERILEFQNLPNCIPKNKPNLVFKEIYK